MHVDESLDETVSEIEETVDLDWDYTEDEFSIYNFHVPENRRQTGVGTRVLTTILSGVREAGINRVRAHIALTAPDAASSREADPTVRFLVKNGFTILDLGNTVEAVKTLDSRND